MPAMLTDLGLQKSDIGIMGTAFYLTYGVSKFLSGVLGDRSKPALLYGDRFDDDRCGEYPIRFEFLGCLCSLPLDD